MRNRSTAVISVIALALALSACTNGQLGYEPPTQVADVQGTTVLQFAVGTANFAGQGVYLNTLETYRQPNGLSAVLYDTPTITGPAGFTVPAAAPPAGNVDRGTSSITGTPPTQPGTTASVSTFAQVGGVFAYGIAPANSNTSGTAFYPGGGARGFVSAVGVVSNTYPQPIFGSSAVKLPFLLAPPAVPDFHDGTFPPGFAGYSSGFTAFAVTPVAGTYTLTVTVPGELPGAAPAAVKTATGTLASTAALPTEPTPAAAPLPGGGGTFTVAPPPAGVTHQILYVVDSNPNAGLTFYSFDATAGGTFALSATAGPTLPNGQHTAPFASGDSVFAYVVGADYDILALAPPENTQPSPALPARADISVSLTQTLPYP